MIRVALFAHLCEISDAETALIATATGLDKQRFQTTLVLPGDGPLLDRARDAKVNIEVIDSPEATYIGRPMPSKAELFSERRSYTHRLSEFLSDGGFDVAYVNTSMSVLPGLAARKAGIPILWHIHETIKSPTLRQRIKYAVIRRVARGFLFASDNVQKAFSPPRNKPSMVPRDALDLTSLSDSARDPELEAKLGIVPGEFIIVANGVDPAKGPDLLVNALALIRINSTRIPVKVILIGRPTEDHAAEYSELVKRVNQLSLGKALVFAGLLSNPAPLLRRADLVVSPSRSEARPMFLLEAMALGVPVIATSVGECPNLLANGSYGLLIPSGDASALTTAIMRAYDCYEEAKIRASAAQKHVLREYASATVWQPLESFIQDIALRAKR